MDPYIVDLVVTSIDPSIDVNPAGQAITIFGLGFPASLTEVPTTFSITFSDVSCTLMIFRYISIHINDMTQF